LGPIEVGVLFLSGVGLAQGDTAIIDLLAEEPVKTGSVRGRVREGPQSQPGVAVELRGPAGFKKEAKTDTQGLFAFEEIPPGKYVVASHKIPTGASAALDIEVGAGPPTPVDVALSLVPARASGGSATNP